MKINESNFIDRLKVKDEKALNYVIETFGGLINSIVKVHLRGIDSMQDECIDDILLAIWYGVDKYRGNHSTFKNWVAGIAKFKAIDYKRIYYKRLLEVSKEEIEIASFETLEDEILKDEINERLSMALAELKKQEKTIFLNYYLKDMSVENISKSSSLKVSAVYNKLSRTRKKLKEYYVGDVLKGE